MIVDTSALVAILLDEPQRDQLLAAIEGADSLKISAPTIVELWAVLSSQDPRLRHLMTTLCEVWQVQVVPSDADQANVAQQAYLGFGKGQNHKAALNLGDCYSYALARFLGVPLLQVGNDFRHTDVRIVDLEV